MDVTFFLLFSGGDTIKYPHLDLPCLFYSSQDVYVILVDLSNNLAGNERLNIVQSWLIRLFNNVIQKVNV